MSEPIILSKKCAIVLPNRDSISIDKYFVAVGDVIGYKNIIYGGKSGQRMVMHLASEELVESFTQEHDHVMINDEKFPVKRLVNPGFKVLFNHVNPSVPNSLLLQEISKYARPLSAITYVHTGLRDARLNHIFSYRRQVFVDVKDNIPNVITVVQDSEVNTIHIFVDNAMKCYSCGVEGHGMKNCPSKSTQPAQDRWLKSSEKYRLTNGAPSTSNPETFVPPPLPTDPSPASNFFIPEFFPDLKKPQIPFNNEIVASQSSPSNSATDNVPSESNDAMDKAVENLSTQVRSSTPLPADTPEDEDMVCENSGKSSKRTLSPLQTPSKVEEKKVKLNQEFHKDFIEAVDTSILLANSSISKNDILKLFRETKNARNKLSIVSNFGLDLAELKEVFLTLSTLKIPPTLKTRTKALLKLLENQADVTDTEKSDNESVTM
ncbi:hypothetical protein M8J76_004425 [Diaphorina citri]|nr:hypothetical protein M8J76_004425 [Diaphorina citri]KAI5752218.1 hypothetical protein M8J77_014978 [Diaphorina citri]